ncbi:MAG: hypothetical protein SCARUB_03929 [Candidatus Scalindua rubra]|uniref:HEPN domain-containing protein n=1 Tax=Candidatus Scalindua rubra TaxID=1872076 RepID=A0A1E3X5Q5_9BACT|nr:MAG: hypothetical protein SCARUB_03929 [Candidatus Scalindua rubra]
MPRGHDLVEALEVLRKSIVDMYYDLDRDKDRLGVDLKKNLVLSLFYYQAKMTIKESYKRQEDVIEN